MRKHEIKPHLRKVLSKLSKKDKKAYEAVLGKIREIIYSEDVERYKNLRYDMKESKRVHVSKSFVLVFSYDRRADFISFVDYDHHDNVYRK